MLQDLRKKESVLLLAAVLVINIGIISLSLNLLEDYEYNRVINSTNSNQAGFIGNF